MLKDITIGQYIPGDSFIHKLDARIKIIITIIMITVLFLIDSFIGFGLFLLFVIAIMMISKLPVKRVLNGLKPVFFLIIITLFLHMFFNKRWRSFMGMGIFKD